MAAAEAAGVPPSDLIGNGINKSRAREASMRRKFQVELRRDDLENPPASVLDSVATDNHDLREGPAAGMAVDEDGGGGEAPSGTEEQGAGAPLPTSPTGVHSGGNVRYSGSGLGAWRVQSEENTAVFDATGGIRSFGSRHAGFVIRAPTAGPLEKDAVERLNDELLALQAQIVETPQSTTGSSNLTDGRSAAGGTAAASAVPEVHSPNDSGKEDAAGGTPRGGTGSRPPTAKQEEEAIIDRVLRRPSGVALADDAHWTEEKSMILLHLHNPQLFNLRLPKVRVVPWSCVAGSAVPDVPRDPWSCMVRRPSRAWDPAAGRVHAASPRCRRARSGPCPRRSVCACRGGRRRVCCPCGRLPSRPPCCMYVRCPRRGAEPGGAHPAPHTALARPQAPPPGSNLRLSRNHLPPRNGGALRPASASAASRRHRRAPRPGSAAAPSAGAGAQRRALHRPASASTTFGRVPASPSSSSSSPQARPGSAGPGWPNHAAGSMAWARRRRAASAGPRRTPTMRAHTAASRVHKPPGAVDPAAEFQRQAERVRRGGPGSRPGSRGSATGGGGGAWSVSGDQSAGSGWGRGITLGLPGERDARRHEQQLALAAGPATRPHDQHQHQEHHGLQATSRRPTSAAQRARVQA